jgi:uncharacterized phiE125 gp8 family phage protein
MARLQLITAPTAEPISLVEARLHLRLDATGSPAAHPDDSLVSSLITAVRQHLEGKDGWLGRALVTQTWELVLDEFPDNEIRIPLPALQSIVSIKYDDAAGAEQTVSASDYVIDVVSEPGWVLPVTGVSWPDTYDTVNAVRVRFTAGYGNAASVPEAIKSAMKLIIGDLYENRQEAVIGASVAQLPRAVEALLSPYRILSVA